MSKMPPQKPGKSEQTVCTPTEFLDALKHKLGIKEFSWDLAANKDNAVTHNYWDEEADSLIQEWHKVGGWQYCNPPYADIEPWVAKAYKESTLGANVAMLLPSSTGANWWKSWVYGKCHIMFMNGRIKFVGHKHLYPKDLVVLLYSPFAGGDEIWTWKESL